ncbi:MAG: hypothetical protein ACKESB_02060 [Candidatus Hodgkinia cicadicola]
MFTFAMALAGPLTGGRRGGGVCGWGGDWCVAEGRRGGGKGAVGGVREKGVGPLWVAIGFRLYAKLWVKPEGF